MSSSSQSVNPRILTRLLALLSARAGTATEALGSFLATRRERLTARFGADAQILMGLRRADDPFAQVGGERKIEPADAILQVSLPGQWPLDDLLRRLNGLTDDLQEMVDLDRSALAMGRAYLMVEKDGPVFCGFLGRRHPGISLEDMRHWWLYHHGPLGVALTGTRSPHGYDQLHVEPDASRQAAAVAGFPYVPYDMGDSLYIEDLDEFVRGTSDPEIQRQLYEDEIGHLDHSSWRGAFTDRI